MIAHSLHATLASRNVTYIKVAVACLLATACNEGGAHPTANCLADAATQTQVAALPACATAGAGLSDCGAEKESCCATLPVVGGTFFRTYSSLGCTFSDQADLATVSNFRLDKYEVTVGRFRQFVAAWNAGWRPVAGSGKHTHLNGGRGLVDANGVTGGGFELGWQDAWTADVVLTTAALTSCSGGNLTVDMQYVPYPCSTWTDMAGAQEGLPIVCVSWMEAYAFCIWDGGFLPSDSEWEYAAAGGDQQRIYPWGWADPGASNKYAIYNCNYPKAENCTGSFNIAPVGTPELGAGRWGQLDLGGNVWEWDLDEYPATGSCQDCVFLAGIPDNMTRGGGFDNFADQLQPTFQAATPAWSRQPDTGFRCARVP